MKAKNIFTEYQYEAAYYCEYPISTQNNKLNYITFGTYGATVTLLYKNGTSDNITVNDWRKLSYKELCSRFDEYISHV